MRARECRAEEESVCFNRRRCRWLRRHLLVDLVPHAVTHLWRVWPHVTMHNCASCQSAVLCANGRNHSPRFDDTIRSATHARLDVKNQAETSFVESRDWRFCAESNSICGNQWILAPGSGWDNVATGRWHRFNSRLGNAICSYWWAIEITNENLFVILLIGPPSKTNSRYRSIRNDSFECRGNKRVHGKVRQYNQAVCTNRRLYWLFISEQVCQSHMGQHQHMMAKHWRK